MKKLIYLLFFMVFVTSCNKIDKPKKPDNLISKNEMVDIITDISLITAASGVQKKVLEAKAINPEEYIYQKYNIDSVQFAESNNYYVYDVKTYEDIYLQVKRRLEKQKEIYVKLEEKEKMEKDSLRKEKIRKRDSIKSKKIPQEPKPSNLLKKDGKSQK